jgi:hypothetical protein
MLYIHQYFRETVCIAMAINYFHVFDVEYNDPRLYTTKQIAEAYFGTSDLRDLARHGAG